MLLISSPFPYERRRKPRRFSFDRLVVKGVEYETMQLVTTKLLPETKRRAKQHAAARGLFLYEYLDELVRRDTEGENKSHLIPSLDIKTGKTIMVEDKYP